MYQFLFGVLVGLSFGYPLGLFIDKLDKGLKDDRLKEHSRTNK